MAKKAASYAAKATFLQLMTEGLSPSAPASKNQLDAWVSSTGMPFSAAFDADPKSFTIRSTYGIKETTYIVERATGKIVAKAADALTGLTKLDAL